MNKVFKFPFQAWLRIGAALLIALLLILSLVWIRNVVVILFLIIPGLITAVWSGAALAWRISKQIVVTDTFLLEKGWFRTRQVAFQDVYYVRVSDQGPPQLTLITLKGLIHLDKRLQNYTELYRILEARIPALLTPGVIWNPLPFTVPAKVSGYIIALVIIVVFWSLGVFLGIIALTEGQPLLIFFSLLLLGVGGLFLYTSITAPWSYHFTAEQIVKRTPLGQASYAVADLKTVYRENKRIKTKQGQRIVPQAVFQFEKDTQLIITADQISTPFSEFAAIIQYHYNPRSRIQLPWKREQVAISYQLFASGSTHEFAWYFTEQSTVEVASIDDICRWLQGCVYINDRQLFLQDDFWQHPITFEQIRKGDCEDHALWAWRKLIELNIEAEFVVGKLDGGGHAWVMFEREGQQYLLEAVHKGKNLILPIDQTTESYQPRCSVDRNFVTYQYEPLA